MKSEIYVHENENGKKDWKINKYKILSIEWKTATAVTQNITREANDT